MSEPPSQPSPESSAIPTPAPVLVLVRDLLLASQIRVAAGHAGVAIELHRDPGKVASASHGRRLIVDCNLAGAVEAAAAYKCRTGHPVVGFVSHVDTQTIAHARSAGLDRVLARSAFFADVRTFLD